MNPGIKYGIVIVAAATATISEYFMPGFFWLGCFDHLKYELKT